MLVLYCTIRTSSPKPSHPVIMGAKKTNRTFDPEKYGVEVYDDPGFPAVRRLKSDEKSIVVAVKGSCRSNGQPSARASYSAFFGPTSTLNRTGRVKHYLPQTNQHAELYALQIAVTTVLQAILEGEQVSHLVIRTNSAYMTLGLIQDVWKWAKNGYMNAKGEPVVNAKAFMVLHGKIRTLEKRYGVSVSIWRSLKTSLSPTTSLLAGWALGAADPRTSTALPLEDRITFAAGLAPPKKAKVRSGVKKLTPEERITRAVSQLTLEERITLAPQLSLEERITRDSLHVYSGGYGAPTL